MATLPTFLTADELAASSAASRKGLPARPRACELPSYKVEGGACSTRTRCPLAGGRRDGGPGEARTPSGLDPLLSNRQRRAPRPAAPSATARAPSRSTRTRGRSSSRSSAAERASSTRRRRALWRGRPGMAQRFMIGAAGRVRPRPIRIAEDCLRSAGAAQRPLRSSGCRPVVEDHIAMIAERAPASRGDGAVAAQADPPRRRGARPEGRPPVYRIRIAKAEEREPRFLTWAEARGAALVGARVRRPGHPGRGADDAPARRDPRPPRCGRRLRERLDRRLRAAPGRQRVATKTRRPPARRRRPRSLRLLREQQLARGRPPTATSSPPAPAAVRRRQLHVARLQAGGRAAGSPSSPSTTSATPARRR